MWILESASKVDDGEEDDDERVAEELLLKWTCFPILTSFSLRHRDLTQSRGGVRDMERGKDVDRERMVHHIQRERERDADREAEQAVDKHFAESLKKYHQSQVGWW